MIRIRRLGLRTSTEAFQLAIERPSSSAATRTRIMGQRQLQCQIPKAHKKACPMVVMVVMEGCCDVAIL